MDLRDRLLAALSALDLLDGRAVVAVSGGPDSVALLDLLVQSRSRHHLALIVAHADHGIQPGSDTVATTVSIFAASLGLPWELGELRLGPDTSETTARDARYAWLYDVARRHGAAAILTAHHADDQAETVLMRVLAGTGPAGLAGMAARSGLIARPLLLVRRLELEEYVRDRGLAVWSDPANADPAHLRSWLRAAVIPTIQSRLPDIVANLSRTARLARANRDAWDAALDVLPGLDAHAEAEGISVAAAPLGGYDSTLAEAVLSALGRRIGCVIGERRAGRLLELVRTGGSGQWVPLGARVRGELAFGRLRLSRVSGAPAAVELGAPSGEAAWGGWTVRWGPAPAPAAHERRTMTAWFAPNPLGIRGLERGERIRPIGGRGTRPLSQCFQEAKVPRSRRGVWPVVEFAGRAVWVPGVCRADALIPEPGAEALRVDITDR